MGVRVSRWVSMHGLALNVTTNLDHFDLIVPCGLAGRAVSSIRAQLGDAGPDLQDVKAVFVEIFRDAIHEQSAGSVTS
jgi:lipoyl(octanoyl) transferase